MENMQDEGCCEHQNCYITFDMSSKEPDIFTHFIMDEGGFQEKSDEEEKDSWERATKADRIYTFCKIHSEALLNHLEIVNGNVSIDYMESIVKSPHFGDEYGR